jgi:hypothetical protein
MRHPLLAVLVAAVYVLHQDLWFWDNAHPILFGVLPIGLAYHILYSIVVAGVMWLLVHYAWPALSDVEGPEHLEDAR